MKKLNAILFSFFAMPVAVFSQAQDFFCFTTQAEAEIKVQDLKNHCFRYWGDGAKADIILTSGTYGGQVKYCAYGTCMGCSGSNVLGAIELTHTIYRTLCCENGMEYIPFHPSMVCQDQPPPFPGGWGLTESIEYDVTFIETTMCRSSSLAFDKHRCEFVENSSSSIESSSSSTKEESSSSSSSGFGGDEPDDEYFSLCFSSISEAWASRLIVAGECEGSGGDASGFEIVPHPKDYLWCLAGFCDEFSTSFDFDDSDGSICRATADELVPELAELIYECISDGNTHTYDIDYVDNPDAPFCITGGCDFPDASSGSSSDSGGSSGSAGSSSSVGSSSSLACRYNCGYRVSGPNMGDDCNPNLPPLSSYYEIDRVYVGKTPFEDGRPSFNCHSISITDETLRNLHLHLDYANCVKVYEFDYFASLPPLISYNDFSYWCHNRVLPSSNSNNSSSPSGESSHSVGSSGSYSEDCYDTYAEAYESSVLTSMACFECGGIANYSVDYAEDMSKYCVRGNCSNYSQSRCPSPPSGISSNSGGDGSSGSVGSSDSGGCPPYPLSHTPADPLSACFSIGGKCYKCNPDRGSECSYDWLWNGSFSEGNVGWWYKEIACGSGSVGSSSSGSSSNYGGCKHNERGENAVYTANDCFSSGLDNMEPDKCYALNPNRGTQYGWINNNAQDTWWWREVPCGEEEYKKCSPAELVELEGSESDIFLQKKSVSEEFWEEVSKGNSVIKSSYLYDILGRRTYDDRKTRRFLLEKPYSNAYNDAEPLVLLMKNPIVFEDKTICGKLGEDYGIAKVGGITCAEVKAYLKKADIFVKQKHIGCREYDNASLEELSGRIIFTIKLIHNDTFYVKAGYVYPDSKETVTKEQENEIRLHELGHQSDNRRVVASRNRVTIPVDIRIVGNKDVIKKEWKLWWENQGNLLAQEYRQKFEEAADTYHRKYGDTGHP